MSNALCGGRATTLSEGFSGLFIVQPPARKLALDHFMAKPYISLVGTLCIFIINDYIYIHIASYACGIQTGEAFHECSSICGTCRDSQLSSMFCNEDCEAGCTCSNGKLLDDHGQCVNQDDCTCYDEYDMNNPIKAKGDISRRGCTDWYVALH